MYKTKNEVKKAVADGLKNHSSFLCCKIFFKYVVSKKFPIELQTLRITLHPRNVYVLLIECNSSTKSTYTELILHRRDHPQVIF